MHIILGLLTAIISLLYILDRLGIDVGYLNPFTWARRRAWAKKYEGDPIYSIEDPIHVAAIFIVGTAKLGDDISSAKKAMIVDLFAQTFSLPDHDANELYISAAHLLGAPQVIETQLTGVADKHRETFSGSQAESLFEMLAEVLGSDSNEVQRAFAAALRDKLSAPSNPQGTWA
jgi:hypothetical protein